MHCYINTSFISCRNNMSANKSLCNDMCSCEHTLACTCMWTNPSSLAVLGMSTSQIMASQSLPLTAPPPLVPVALKESSKSNHGHQTSDTAASVTGTQKRRVSFAPTLSGPSLEPDVVITRVDISSSGREKDLRRLAHTHEDSAQETVAAARDTDEVADKDSVQGTTESSVGDRFEFQPPRMEYDGALSPSSDISDEESIASSRSSSTSNFELTPPKKRGRGRRGRGRARKKAGSRRGVATGGGMEQEEQGGEEGVDEAVTRGRGRGRKRRGRGGR